MGTMGGPSPQSIALLLNQEISAVVTAMRQNVKWSMVPTRYTVSLNCHLQAGSELVMDVPYGQHMRLLTNPINYQSDFNILNSIVDTTAKLSRGQRPYTFARERIIWSAPAESSGRGFWRRSSVGSIYSFEEENLQLARYAGSQKLP